MTTSLSIKIKLMNGEILTFKNDSAVHFEFQQWGTLFVEGAMQVDIEKAGKITKKVKYANYRYWTPISNIKNVEILTKKELTDPEEIRKWEKFKKHGLDLMVTPVSHTNPKTQEEVEKEIKKEEKAKN